MRIRAQYNYVTSQIILKKFHHLKYIVVKLFAFIIFYAYWCYNMHCNWTYVTRKSDPKFMTSANGVVTCIVTAPKNLNNIYIYLLVYFEINVTVWKL